MNNSTHQSQTPLSKSDFLEQLKQAESRWKQRKIELDSMITKLPLILFGFGGKGQSLAHHIQKHTKWKLSIFDSSPIKRALAKSQGFRVLDSLTTDLTSQSAVILSACQAQLEQKKSVGENYIYYQEAASLFGAPHLQNFATDFQEFVLEHTDELYEILTNLTPISQTNMLAVLMFRLSLDPIDLQSTRRPDKLMWVDIPAEYRVRPYDFFLDVGAFDGDTLRLFREKFNCIRGIAVEANATLFEDIQRVSEKYPKGVKILPMAAWSKNTRLNFEEVRFGMIKVNEDADGPLQASPIDDYVTERVDVLKMDIEGAEVKALEGSSRLLNTWKPDLALAAYHRPNDFINLFYQLSCFGYCDGEFELHFAHYSDCLDDSIFYFIRKI
jgi:FkbM family methyltransferase